MNARIVNAFIDSVVSTLKNSLRVNPKLGKPSIVQKLTPDHSIVTILGITGNVDGNLIYTFSNETGLKVVSAMMGMEYNQLDEIALSAFGELGNMTVGKLTMNLEKLGFSTDVTPPTVISGKDLKMKTEGKILKLPLALFKENDVDVCLIIKE